MKKIIKSPFFSIKNNDLLYLKKYKICQLPQEDKIKEDIMLREGAIFEIQDFKKKNKSVLVLEPHPDDFALSALAYSINSYDVQVLNIFTKTTLDYFPWKDKVNLNSEQYEELRIKESIFAINKMLKQNFSTIREKSTRITDKKETEIKEIIIKATLDILNNNKTIETILVPMGVGEHPDHIIIYNTIMENYNLFKDYKIVLYPEYPYARSNKNYNDRLEFIKRQAKIRDIKIKIDKYLDLIVNAIMVYKSQFDDINREQMLAIVREDCWGVGQDYKKEELDFIYYAVEGKKI